MTAFRAGEVFYEFIADTSKLVRAANDTERMLGRSAVASSNRYEQQFNGRRLGRRIADDIGSGFRAGTNALRATFRAGTAIAGVASVAAGSFAVIAAASLNTAREIENLSTISGVNAETFKELAFGADQLGISKEKLGDILKDTNDKFGDFFQTGAGPLNDFFEQIAPRVGVTADSFRNLSSDQALGLYISSLEKANLSQADMTFFLEAVASDATALLPLFTDNGRAAGEFADQARGLGLVLSNDLISQGAEASRTLDVLGQTIRGGIRGEIIEAAPEIQELAENLTSLIPLFIDWTSNIVEGFNELSGALSEVSERITLTRAAVTTGNFGDDNFRTDVQLLQDSARISENIARVNETILELRRRQAEQGTLSGTDQAGLNILEGRVAELGKERAERDAILNARREIADVEAEPVSALVQSQSAAK